jgi:hypothetical protein
MIALADSLAKQDGLFYIGGAIRELTWVMWAIAAILATICFRLK